MRAIIVGAGVLGCAVALSLLEHDVGLTIIDISGLAGDSASMAAGAMLGALGEVTAEEIIEDGDPVPEARLAAARMYPGWLARICEGTGSGVDVGRGTTIVASAGCAGDRVNLRSIQQVAVSEGVRHEVIDPLDIPWIDPAPECPVIEALFLPDEGWLDPADLLQQLNAILARDSRVTFMHDRVARLTSDNRRVTGVVTEGGWSGMCDWVVVCAGAATASLVRTVDGDGRIMLPVYPGSGTSMVLSGTAVPEGVVRTPNRDFACGLHLVPRGADVYVGATNRVATDVGAVGRVTAGEVHLLLDAAIHQFNVGLERAELLSMRAGMRPISADRTPQVGMTDLPGLAVATGTYRNGILLAPLVGQIIADELTAEGGGTRIVNPFSPRGRVEQFERKFSGLCASAGESAGSLVYSLSEPGGRLPYGRARMVATLMRRLVGVAIDPDADPEVTALLRQELAALPLAEVVPEFAILLAQNRRDPAGSAS